MALLQEYRVKQKQGSYLLKFGRSSRNFSLALICLSSSASILLFNLPEGEGAGMDLIPKRCWGINILQPGHGRLGSAILLPPRSRWPKQDPTTPGNDNFYYSHGFQKWSWTHDHFAKVGKLCKNNRIFRLLITNHCVLKMLTPRSLLFGEIRTQTFQIALVRP